MDRRGAAVPPVVVALILFAIVAIYFGYLAYHAIMVPPPKEPVETFDRVAIVVHDAITGEPVEDASVKLANVYADVESTDEDGRAVFEMVPAGTYTVTIKRDGYYWQTRSLNIQGFLRVFSQTFRITQFGQYSASVEDKIIAPDTTTVTFVGTFRNTKENSICRATTVTIDIEAVGMTLDKLETTTGQAITTITEGKKYSMALGDMTVRPEMVEFKATISGADPTDRLEFTWRIDDGGLLEGEVGATAVTVKSTITCEG